MGIVIVSDPHIGDYPYGKTDSETGLNSRLLDFLKNLEKTIDFAIEKSADAYVIVGDIYRIKHPNSKIRRQFASKLRKLIKAGIRTVLLTGNHDMTASSDGAHALSEMEELCEMIDSLEVYSKPKVIKVNDCKLYLLPFVNRSQESLLTPQDFLKYQIEKIEEFNELTLKSKNTYNLFFGHFGTDKSVIGNSFDLDMSSDENENKVSLSTFDDGNWTKVYLGHIHQQQEFNKIARHVGSLGRVDFGEEDEQKGFYWFHNGNDEFIPVDDREFKTFSLKLTDEKCKDVLANFINELKDLSLDQAIVRIKADISQTYYPVLDFNTVETYLRKNTWHFLGTNINIIADKQDDNVEEITTSDLPNEALKKHIDRHPDRFKGIEDKALAMGIEILKQARENRS